MATWLDDAVFYEIYPQSFLDTDGDGIGDFEGIIRKLDYIKGLGCNAIWLNPCYDSPFKDAGYDVRDYRKVAERYGTIDDLKRLFAVAHEKGMHILLDLVPGHTSEEHAWFALSKKAERNEYTDRYIWTDGWLTGGAGLNFVAGESERNSAYIVNFFKCQPALNYGFLHPTEPWQKSMNDPACLATREAVKDVMRYWLDLGCDGFRADMADSLVKNDDENKSGTVAVWRDMLDAMHAEYPEAAFVSEWGRAEQSIPAGFDMDFYLDWAGNGYNSLVREYETHIVSSSPSCHLELPAEDRSFFRADSDGGCEFFIKEYMERYEKIKSTGAIAMITGNHDTARISRNLTNDELKLAYAFLFTMPGNPFLYYGDELGMRYLDLPSKEGGYTRTGSRTPMQWTNGTNKGFSEADPDTLYLPVDSVPDAPTVEAAEADPGSLLNTLKRIIAIRHAEPDLKDKTNLEILSAKPLVYRRGTLLLSVNPKKEAETYDTSAISGDYAGMLYSLSAKDAGRTPRITDGILQLPPQSFCIMRIV